VEETCGEKRKSRSKRCKVSESQKSPKKNGPSTETRGGKLGRKKSSTAEKKGGGVASYYNLANRGPLRGRALL